MKIKMACAVVIVLCFVVHKSQAKMVTFQNDAGIEIEFSAPNGGMTLKPGQSTSYDPMRGGKVSVTSKEAEAGTCNLDAKKVRENNGNHVRIWISAKRKLIGKTKLKCEHTATSATTEKVGAAIGGAALNYLTSRAGQAR